MKQVSIVAAGLLATAASAIGHGHEQAHHHAKRYGPATVTQNEVHTDMVYETVWVNPAGVPVSTELPKGSGGSGSAAPGYTPPANPPPYQPPTPPQPQPSSSSAAASQPLPSSQQPPYTPSPQPQPQPQPQPSSSSAPYSSAAPAPSAPAPSQPSSSSQAAPAPSGGPSPGGYQFQGEVTFYAAGLGSCGQTNGPDDSIVALSHTYMDSAKDQYCGKKLSIKGPGGTFTATVADTCPGCDATHLDLPQGFYDKVTANNEKAGLVAVSWGWA